MAEEEEEQVLDFGKKKKKTKKSKKDDEEGAEIAEKNVGYYEFTRGHLWSHTDMLQRVHDTIAEMNAGFGLRDKCIIKPPQCVRVGSRRSGWVNFQEYVTALKRSPEHLLQYTLAEFGAEGTLAGNGQLLLKGKYTAKNVESLLKKYIKEYVQCAMCKSTNTVLERDQSTRLHIVKCGNCGANRSAATIKSGFHAVAKGERKAARTNAGKVQVTG